MSQGLLTKLMGGVTNATGLPKYSPPDSRLVAGSLMLIDFSDPSYPAGVPANGAKIKNLAHIPAKGMIPAGTEDTLSPTVANTIVSGRGLMEITPKKGLHGIITKVNDQSANLNDYEILFPANIRDYLLDNPTHEFYASHSFRRTRISGTNTSSNFYLLQNTSNVKFEFSPVGTIPGSGDASNYLGADNSPTTLNQLGIYFRSIGFKGFVGAIPSDRSLLYFKCKWGSSGPFTGTELNNSPSDILYSLYIEDLTVSGRTYAAAKTADLAYHNAAFASGGKFFGDTFTDPATLP